MTNKTLKDWHKSIKKLDEKFLIHWHKSIKREIPYVDIKPYSHNIISISLRAIAENFGRDEANKAIRGLHLEELGWKEIKSDTI